MKIYKIFISISLFLEGKAVAVDKEVTSLTNRSTESARKFPFKINWVITRFITLSFGMAIGEGISLHSPGLSATCYVAEAKFEVMAVLPLLPKH